MGSKLYSAELKKFVCTQASEPLIDDIAQLMSEQRHAEAQWWQERQNLVAARVTQDKLDEFDAKVYTRLQDLAAKHRKVLAEMEIPLVYSSSARSDQQKFLAFLSDLCG